MADFMSSNSARVQFYDGPELFQIRINDDVSMRNVVRTIFPIFTFSAFIVFGIYQYDWFDAGFVDGNGLIDDKGILVFIAFFALFSMLSLNFFWVLFGYELLSLSGGRLTIKRRLFFFGRAWAHKVDSITNLRIAPTEHIAVSIGRHIRMRGLYSSPTVGTVKFNAGSRTMGFGIELEQEDARLILDKLETRLAASSRSHGRG